VVAIPATFFAETWAGKVRTLPYEPLVGTEKEIFDRDFTTMYRMLKNLDVEVAEKLWAEKDWYEIAAGIFKDHVDLPFGGMETSSGQFGFVGPVIPAYPFLAADTWEKTVAAPWQNFWGSSSVPIAGVSTIGSRRMYAYQGLISLGASTGLQFLRFTINGYDYPVQSVELYSKVRKPLKYIEIIPLPAKVLIHMTGNHYVRAAFHAAKTVEILPLGFMFAEHDYIKTETNLHT